MYDMRSADTFKAADYIYFGVFIGAYLNEYNNLSIAQG